MKLMQHSLRLLALLGVFTFGFSGLVACEQQGPFEETGEEIDESVDEVDEGLEDAGDDLDDVRNEP